MEGLFNKFRLARGVTIKHNPRKQWDKDVYDYITTDLALYIVFVQVDAADSNAGGARQISRIVDDKIRDGIIDAVYENPNSNEFFIEVSKNAAIYDTGAMASQGGVEVYALN